MKSGQIGLAWVALFVVAGVYFYFSDCTGDSTCRRQVEQFAKDKRYIDPSVRYDAKLGKGTFVITRVDSYSGAYERVFVNTDCNCEVSFKYDN